MFAILANLEMSCEFGKVIENLAMGCEVGKAIANLAMWFAKLAEWFAKLAMRNFAKLLKFLCEKRSSQMYSVLWLANFAMLRTGCQQFAKFAMVANWLPTVCQFRKGCQLVANWLPKFLLCCFSKYAPKFAHKLLKLMQEKLHKGTN